MNIGLVQVSAQTADFPHNLRVLVQGYRGCLDRGAELVVADAFSLCGPPPADLALRSSFLRQEERALAALSHELAGVPLLLAAHAAVFPTDGGQEAADAPCGGGAEMLPVLVERDAVSVIEGEVAELEGGRRVYAACGEGWEAFGRGCDLIVCLSGEPWFAGCRGKWPEAAAWEAAAEGLPLACLRPVGAADGFIWGGGSTLHAADGRLLAALSPFDEDFCVASTAATGRRRTCPPPDPAEELFRALQCGVRDHARRNGYLGACLALDERPASLLLAWLAIKTFGAENTVIRAADSLPGERRNALCAMGAELRRLPGGMPEYAAMACAALDGEREGWFPLSSLSQSEILGGCGLERVWGTLLLPFGDLYEGDLRLLADFCREKAPELPALYGGRSESPFDAAFQLLEDGNLSATELLARPDCPVDEQTLRKAQRLLIASAWKRKTLPPFLHVGEEKRRRRYPGMHRLND